MEVDKQLRFKSNERMQVEFISNNVDVMTHDSLSRVALSFLNPNSALRRKKSFAVPYGRIRGATPFS